MRIMHFLRIESAKCKKMLLVTASLTALLFGVGLDVHAEDDDIFKFGIIPFGDSPSSVLRRIGIEPPLKSVTMYDRNDGQALASQPLLASVEEVLAYENTVEYFGGGIYKMYGQPGYLLQDSVTVYSLTRYWPGVERVKLFFFRPPSGAGDSRLFMVYKQLVPLAGGFGTNIAPVTDSVMDSIGSPPDEEIATSRVTPSADRQPAQVKLWDTKTVRVLFLASESGHTQTRTHLSFVYIHMPLWRAYLEAAEAFEDGRQEEAQRSRQRAGDSF